MLTCFHHTWPHADHHPLNPNSILHCWYHDTLGAHNKCAQKQYCLCWAHIREKILSATLAHHHNDIEKYLIFIKNNLQMITSKTYSRKNQGLITYILQQLELTTNPILLHQVQDLHIQYQENKLPKYTPQKLVCDIEDKIRVLKHAEAWTTLHVPEQPMMAMHTPIRYSTKRIPSQSNYIQTMETFQHWQTKWQRWQKKRMFSTPGMDVHSPS